MKTLTCLIALFPLLASAAEKATLDSPSFLCKLDSLASTWCEDSYERKSEVLIAPVPGRGTPLYYIWMRARFYTSFYITGPYLKQMVSGMYLITQSPYATENQFFYIDTNTGYGIYYHKHHSDIWTDARLSQCRIVDDNDRRAAEERLTTTSDAGTPNRVPVLCTSSRR